MRQIEYEAMTGRLKDMQAQGLAVQDQFLTQLRNNRLGALEAAAQGINTIVETNKTYLQMHANELDAVRTEAQIIYQGIQADIGVNQAAMDQANGAYETYMAPYIDALNMYLVQTQIDEMEGDPLVEGVQDVAAIGAGIITGAAVGTAIPVIGTVVGAIVGGIIGLFGVLFG